MRKTLLEKVEEVNTLIRQLQKMESKMRSGQWIDAWREVNRIISVLDAERKEIIFSETGDKGKDEK